LKFYSLHFIYNQLLIFFFSFIFIVDISLDKGDENENLLDNTDLNLPDIESFDFTIDNTNKLDDGVDDDSGDENKEEGQDADKRVNISMDDVSINEDKSENFDNEISNIQADDNDEVPIISAVEPNGK